jgi:ABC-type protease/lipase transport system fused ATPase/permease subunit
MAALDYLRGRLQGVAGNLLSDALSPTVAKVMLATSARRSERVSAEALRDVATLRNLFSAQGLLALFDTPWVLVYVAVIWLAHPALGMAALAASVLMLAIAVLNDRLTRRDIEALQKEAAKATRYLEASMHNAEVVQSLGMGEALIGRWRKLSAAAGELQRPTARKSVAMTAVTRIVRQ